MTCSSKITVQFYPDEIPVIKRKLRIRGNVTSRSIRQALNLDRIHRKTDRITPIIKKLRLSDGQVRDKVKKLIEGA